MESNPNAGPGTARAGVLRWIAAVSLAAVAGVVAAAVMVFEEPARAAVGQPGELVYERGAVAWRLQQAECAHPAMSEALLLEGAKSEYKAAVVHQGARTWSACWSEDSDRDVLLVDVNGTTGFMPRQWFRPPT